MNKLRSKRITLTLCETLIYKPQNPKPSCAEIRSSLPRRPRQALPCAELAFMLTRRPRQALQCARTSLTAHEVTSTGSPVRRTGLPAHEATSTGHPVRRTGLPAHEATSTGSPVRQNKPSCSRGDLDRLSRAPEQALLLTRRPRQALPCARKSLLLTRPMNMTAGAPEGRFHARKTILREGNQLVAELDFPVAEFVEALVTSTGSVPYMT